jgi:hypothetical protein
MPRNVLNTSTTVRTIIEPTVIFIFFSYTMQLIASSVIEILWPRTTMRFSFFPLTLGFVHHSLSTNCVGTDGTVKVPFRAIESIQYYKYLKFL